MKTDFDNCLSPESFRIPTACAPSAWIEHTPFAMWLMEAVRPRCLVELGTHYGVSYFTFCEAAAGLTSNTRCFAVDTWKGDEHTGCYDEDVWEYVSKINADHYGHFSTLIRQTFNDAVSSFADGTIDLLHIDGQHFYQDVSNDFQTWLPKLSTAAVVLLHDTNVYERGFGVARLFHELQKIYPTFEFLHGHGLGIVAVGAQPPSGLESLLKASSDPGTVNAVRSAYARLGAGIADRLALRHEKKIVEGLRHDIVALHQIREATAAIAAEMRVELAKAISGATAAHAEVQAARLDVAAHVEAFRLADAQRRRADQQLSIIETQRDQLLASTSWRVTAPLRWTISGTRHPRRALLAARRPGKNGPIEALRKVTLFVRGLPGARVLARPVPLPATAANPRETPGSATGFVYRPLISVIVPVLNVGPEWLRRAVASVRAQTYPNWELCICDDGSTAPGTVDALRDLERTEPKLRVRRLLTNLGISRATNEALGNAKGEFVAFLDSGDELARRALETCVAAFNHNNEIDVLYSDEAKLDPHIQKESAFLKPDWSPGLLREMMYVGHILVVRRSLIEKIGGLDPIYDGVQDFELMLRLSEHTRRIHHVRDILYYCRRVPTCVAEQTDAQPTLDEKQVAAVNAHLSRLGIAAQAESHPNLVYRAIVKPNARRIYPGISIVVPTKDAPESISRCLDSIYTRTDYPNFEVVVVDNETTDRQALAAMARHPVIRIPFAGRFNFSRANNIGVAATHQEVIVLLSNDMEVVHGDWLEQLLFLLDDPDVAAVGPLLSSPDGTVQSAGVALGIGGSADHVLRSPPADTDFDSLACTREVSAVSFACVMMRRSDYDSIGGLQELYSTQYADVDLCLRLREQGRRILYTPRTSLIHHDSVTYAPVTDAMDRALLLDAWGTAISAGDPYCRWEPAARADVRAA
jgi:GT2 family glycosyltransferase